MHITFLEKNCKKKFFVSFTMAADLTNLVKMVNILKFNAAKDDTDQTACQYLKIQLHKKQNLGQKSKE